MNTCVICQGDGVLQVQTAWYCHRHAVDGAMQAVMLVSLWAKPSYSSALVDAIAGVMDRYDIPVNHEARYWCENCQVDRFTDDDCWECGYGVDEKEDE